MSSVRILDIASEAGVSRSLVSKVLSGRMGTSTVRPELASRIRKIAQARGFVPNAAARSLHSGRQDCIAVFLSRHGTEGSALLERFLDGATRELARAGKRIGKPLEAAVTLRPRDGAAKETLDRLSDMDLAELFIVSECLIAEDGAADENAAVGTSSRLAGLSISVVEAPGVKCPRCWKHSTAADPETGLCPRCASVVAKL
jgi:transcriptional regulator with XRE-family HTH domain